MTASENRPHILLVDDEPMVREAISFLLSDMDYTCDEADTMAAASQLLDAIQYDLVITDYRLEDHDGLEIIDSMRDKKNTVPVILITGAHDEELTEEALRHGACALLPKPFEPDELARVIGKALNGKGKKDLRKTTCEMVAVRAGLEEEWSPVFDAIPDMVSLLDKNYRLIRVNMAFAAAFDMEPESVIGKKCYEIMHKTDAPCPTCPHRETLETKSPTRALLYDEGVGKHLEVSVAPIIDRKGEILGSIHIAKDVTESILEKEELQRIRAAMLDSADALLVTREDGSVAQANRSFEKIFGYERNHLDRFSLPHLFLKPEEHQQVVAQLRKDGHAEQSCTLRREDSSQFQGHVQVNLIREKEGPLLGAVYTFHDLTHAKKEAEQRSSKDRLQGALEMAGTACHQLNQPLQAISIYATMLLRKLEQDTRESEQCRIIKEQSDRMSEITRRLNKITRYKTVPYIEHEQIIDLEAASRTRTAILKKPQELSDA